jgi:hypothetical protein
MQILPRKWLAGALLALGAALALFVSALGPQPWHYAAGLLLFAGCVLGIFALISTGWGPSPLARVNPLPANGAVRWAVGGLAGVVGFAGLFRAAAVPPDSIAYSAGIAAFVLAAGYAFVLLKDWFDRLEAGRAAHG